MADAVITYTDEDTGLVFQWHGGAYIEVGYIATGYVLEAGRGSHTEQGFQATDVINVWRYADDVEESTFELAARHVEPFPGFRPFRYILESFEQRCQEYLTEQQDESEA